MDKRKQKLIDKAISALDILKKEYPSIRIMMEVSGQYIECNIKDALIYDDPHGNIMIDAE